MLGILKKLDTFVEFIQFAVCGLIVFAIMWLTFFSVIFRYVLNNSIVWAEEVLRYLMMWVVLVGAGLTTREDQHVSMDIMQSFLKRWPKARAVHYFITRLIVFVFMCYLIGPSIDLIQRSGNSTATSLVWLHKSVVYVSFICGIISVNLSLLSQVPRKIYDILHNIEDDELILEARALADEFDKELNQDAPGAADGSGPFGGQSNGGGEQ